MREFAVFLRKCPKTFGQDCRCPYCGGVRVIEAEFVLNLVSFKTSEMSARERCPSKRGVRKERFGSVLMAFGNKTRTAILGLQMMQLDLLPFKNNTKIP